MLAHLFLGGTLGSYPRSCHRHKVRRLILVTTLFHSRKSAPAYSKFLGPSVKVTSAPVTGRLTAENWWRTSAGRREVISNFLMLQYYRATTMRIDFHVHCFPDQLAARALEVLVAGCGIAPAADGTVAGLRRSMSRAGIDLSVIQSIATKPAQTQAVNDWAAQAQDHQILAFGSIHPGYEGWRDEVARLRELGIKGVKFHPDYQDYYVDDEKAFPLYEEIARAGLIILFHAGIDVGLPNPCHTPPDRLARVVKAFPGARIVAAHMGGYRSWDGVEKHLAGLDLFLDTSYGLGHMSKEQFLRLLEAQGNERILFATDSPWADQSQEIAKLEELCLPAETMQAIFSGNAKRLLGIAD